MIVELERVGCSSFITFKKIVSKNGKEFNCIHSGNLNDILLPCKTSKLPILRRGIEEAKEKKGLI